MDEPSHTAERPLKSDRTPGRRYDLYGGGPALEVFVDGLSDMMLGPYVSRLVLHTTEGLVQESGDPALVEQRRIKLRLVVPTPALIEIAQIVLRNVSENAGLLSAAFSQNAALYQELGIAPSQLPVTGQKE